MRVLVTGGAGYIGSFAVQRLIKEGCEVIVYDNFSTGFREALHPECHFVFGDVRDRELPARVMRDYRVDAVMHFAAKLIVPESKTIPTEYYDNNFCGGLNLVQNCIRAGVNKFIFSSTASVYGDPPTKLVSETDPVNPVSPYGHSKLFMEQLLKDSRVAHGLNFIILRYFNVAGAALDFTMGQRTANATHLMKVAAEAAAGKRSQIEIYGTDYPTPDGTAIRDFIHVEDLIDAHWLSLKHIMRTTCGEVYNCGYGEGYSVMQVIDTMEKVSGKKLLRVHGPRREADIVQIVAQAQKIRDELGWKPKYNNLELICRTTYEWEKKS